MRIDAAERRTSSDEERELMQLVRGLRALALTGVVAGIGVIAVGTGSTASIVADDACPYYAVDMAASATCENQS